MHLQLKTVRWKNFLSTGNQFTEVDFEQHKTTLIIGANGAGKTTMLDALCYALFNKSFRKANKPDLINWINNKGMLVEVEFTIGENHYLVRRGLKPSVFDIVINGTLLDQESDNRDYQDFLERHILKTNFKSFTQIVIVGKSNFVPFMQLAAAGRREVVEDFLDLKSFSLMSSMLKEKQSENNQSINETTHQIELLEQAIKINMQNQGERQEDNKVLIQELEDQINELKKERENYNQSLSSIRSLIDKLNKDAELITCTPDQLTSNKMQIAVIDNKLSDVVQRLTLLQHADQCPTCLQSLKNEKHTSLISDWKKDQEDLQKAKEQQLSEAKSILFQLDKLKAYSKEISTLQSRLFEVNTNISSTDEMINQMGERINNLRQMKRDISNKAADQLEELVNKKKTLQTNLAELKAQAKIYDYAGILLKDSGIKAKIIKQYIPVINSLINRYLQQMQLYHVVELNEVFAEKITTANRTEASYESFSEGEKMRFDLAILFTWRQIAKMRNSLSCNLLIFDEVMDGSLDTSGTDEFLKIIQQLTHNQNIFIISHKVDQIIDKFENVIKFEVRKNFSVRS